MSPRPSLIPEWEEQTERRLGVVEQKVDKLLDPETGIYPRMLSIESRLKSWAITLLTTIIVVAIEVLIQILTR